MKKRSNKLLDVRLLDIFFTGIVKIYVSFYIKNIYLRYYLLIDGILTILFNGYNYLYFNLNQKYLPLKFLNTYSHPKKGKPQFHRLFINLLVMYPIYIYILITQNLPILPFILLFIVTFTGFAYNFYNFIKYI
jgi:hypothetical protein